MKPHRINFTNRAKLTRRQVDIELSPREPAPADASARGGGGGAPRTFEAQLRLPNDLPADARVFVEAFRTSPAAVMRFDYGTVGDLREPSDRRLTAFQPTGPPPSFAVKVSDTRDGVEGRLLALAKRIKPIDPSEDESQRGILLTHWRDNRGLIWELDLDYGPGPLLWIDERADPDRDLPNNPLFKATVYPEVIRRVLTHVLIDERGAGLEDDESWHGQWVRLVAEVYRYDQEPPPVDASPEEHRGWIADAVRHCGREAGLVDSIRPKQEE